MEITFTQFFMPDGRQKPVIIDRPDDVGEKAKQLLDSGCRLEIEMLQTGEISMTVERDQDDGEIDLLAQKICNNGPAVLVAIDELINNASVSVEDTSP